MTGREHRLAPNLEERLLWGPPWPWDLLPGVTDIRLEQTQRKASPHSDPRVTAALVFLRDVLVLLVVGFGRRSVAFLL